MPDCRNIVDPKDDLQPLAGGLLKGSTAMDIASASFVPGSEGWDLRITTANVTPQYPVGEVTVGLYLDRDGRTDNNAPIGLRLGADSVLALVWKDQSWRVTSEAFVPNEGWKIRETKATFAAESNGYTIHIPYAELSREPQAHWRAGIAVTVPEERLSSFDFAPDAGLSCAPTIGEAKTTGIVDVPVGGSALIPGDVLAKIIAAVLVTLLIVVLLSRKFRTIKDKGPAKK